jgi:hypothetical protein
MSDATSSARVQALAEAPRAHEAGSAGPGRPATRP